MLKPRVRVPQLIADDQSGNQLVEDLGAQDLAGLLQDDASAAERAGWLSKAVAAAAEIASIPDPAINPPFDAALFRRELDLAREAVFDLYLESPLRPEEREVHDRWAAALASEIEAHPRSLCHRDFHGNNLFPMEDSVAAIDFQDMRSGPDSYDLASLLWERTTLDWMTEDLAGAVVEQFVDTRRGDRRAFADRLDRVLLQRAWKVCGTFARAVAAGKGEVYRRYLPGEVRLARRLLSDRPEDAQFARLFDARLGGPGGLLS